MIEKDPGLVDRMLEDNQTVGTLFGRGGSVAAKASRREAAAGTASLLDLGEQNGASIAPDHPAIIDAVARLRDEVSRGRNGAGDAQAVDEMFQQWMDSHAASESPPMMKASRKEVQRGANSLFNRRGAGTAADEGALGQRFDAALQNGIGKAMDEEMAGAGAPGYLEGERATQGRIGSEKAVRRAENIQQPWMRRAMADLAAGSTAGYFTHSVPDAIGAGVAAHVLQDPAVLSRAAIAADSPLFTSPASRELLHNLPRSAWWLFNQGGQ